jgi:HlyD family secretion protein
MNKRLWALLAGAVVLVLLILWMSGTFVSDRIHPGKVQPTAQHAPPAATTTARLAEVAEIYEAVGTVRPRTETRVESQVTAKIVRILARPGSKVAKGATLIVLDNRELTSRRDQARQALNSALAARDQAASQHRRIMALFEEKAVTSQELERTDSERLQTQAAVRRVRNMLEEAEIALGYAEIKALDNAMVVERLADPGDLAFPGKPLLLIRTSGSLRLEALVREGLISTMRPGRELLVSLPALGAQDALIQGMVEEVVPSADPRTRTFLVKVALPALPGLYPGMFGRLMVPVKTRPAVVVPSGAIRRVGQLETVRLLDGETWRDVFVTTGQPRPDAGLEMVEILSGLDGGESLALDFATGEDNG